MINSISNYYEGRYSIHATRELYRLRRGFGVCLWLHALQNHSSWNYSSNYGPVNVYGLALGQLGNRSHRYTRNPLETYSIITCR